MNDNNKLTEYYVSGEALFSGKILNIYRDTVRLPDNRLATRELIRHIGAVCVIPVTDAGNIILERQFRYPVGRVITEIPAGKLDSSTEDRLSAAKRELLEETGYSADTWISLGDYYPAAAYSDERITMYLAQDLHCGAQKLDDGEFLQVFEYPLTKAVEDVMNGLFPDGKTQAAILKAARYLGV